LSYQGSEQFKTIPGAIASLIVISLLLAYGCYKSYVLLNRVNPSISKAGYIRSLDNAGSFRP